MERIKHVPKLSTDTIGKVINMMVRNMPDDQCYLNVGVWHGFSLFAGMLDNPTKRCIGVDNFVGVNPSAGQKGTREEFYGWRDKLPKSRRHEFYEMDYEGYFKNHHKGKIGVYFYDGDHSYEHQLKGLELAEPFFADNCLILIDDTNWEQVRRATTDFMRRGGYEIILEKRTETLNSCLWWNGIQLLRRTAMPKQESMTSGEVLQSV